MALIEEVDGEGAENGLVVHPVVVAELQRPPVKADRDPDVCLSTTPIASVGGGHDELGPGLNGLCGSHGLKYHSLWCDAPNAASINDYTLGWGRAQGVGGYRAIGTHDISS